MNSIEPIVELQLEEVRQRLAERRISLVLSPAAMDNLCIEGYDPVFGARPLKRLIQRNVVDTIATEIVSGKVHDGDTCVIDYDMLTGKYSIEVSRFDDLDSLLS